MGDPGRWAYRWPSSLREYLTHLAKREVFGGTSAGWRCVFLLKITAVRIRSAWSEPAVPRPRMLECPGLPHWRLRQSPQYPFWRCVAVLETSRTASLRFVLVNNRCFYRCRLLGPATVRIQVRFILCHGRRQVQ